MENHPSQGQLAKTCCELVQLTKKINKGNRQAATIGLFPHALGIAVAAAGFEMDDLSRPVIRACANRFYEYLRLAREAEDLRTGAGKPNTKQCPDPFHHLNLNLPKQLSLRATCQCESRQEKETTKSEGVINEFTTKPTAH